MTKYPRSEENRKRRRGETRLRGDFLGAGGLDQSGLRPIIIKMRREIQTFFVVVLTAIINIPTTQQCGYQSCNPVKEGMINVHLVPHTHNDVGWLKTVDQYFYGDKNYIQVAGVQYILDSVVQELMKDPNKRFIYVEIGFFSRWWKEQSQQMKLSVKKLVDEGRLEFILGGWSMDDEATTHYNAMIDEHTLGFQFLQENFGECGRPRVAWQIDPFGHSREHASLFARMGFDGLFFGRLDYQDKAERMKTKTMEMIWQGSPKNLGSQSDLFTGVLYNLYNPPGGFCFDVTCHDDPIMDDPNLHDYNVPQRVAEFINATRTQAESYATKHLIMTMGSDFNYQIANMWYKNLDKLIHYVNKEQERGSDINLLYSTPSCYLYQLNKANLTWPTKQDDFFPYAIMPHGFLTGYYTSRPALKRYVRHSNNFLQACKHFDVFSSFLGRSNYSGIQMLKEAMGVAQHHDAVSGTEKQAVADDYALRLFVGTNSCQNIINDAYKLLVPIDQSVPLPEQQFCNLLNISKCSATEENKQLTVTIYNPLARNISRYISIPTTSKSCIVTDPFGRVVTSQIVPISMETKRIPERKGSIAENNIVFQVLLPPLGYSTYFVRTNTVKDKQQETKQQYFTSDQDVTMNNTYISVTFDGVTGNMKMIKNLQSGVSSQVDHRIQYYTSHFGNRTVPMFEGSGAYIFRPNQSVPLDLEHMFPVQTKYLHGNLVQEVHQQFSPWVSTVTRLYNDAQYLETEWTVGPIPTEDGIGKEVISKYCSDLKTESTFYTDANGREILLRARNYRPTWDFNNTEPVAGNYFPVSSRIYLQDTKRNIQLTVLTDRSQGGSSIQDGCVELMVHRRLVVDDNLGVGEALNETGADGQGLVVRGKHYLFLDTIDRSAQLHRDMALKLYMEPVLSFTNSQMKQSEWSKHFRTQWSALGTKIPRNVHILTLEHLKQQISSDTFQQQILLRLEHIYEKGEGGQLSNPAKVELRDLLRGYEVLSATELTLGANFKTSDLNRLPWKYKSDSDENNLKFIPYDENNLFKILKGKTILNRLLKVDDNHLSDNLVVTLNPMEIKTFHITVKKT
ncbi:hypothetical protein FSP39_021156 [Pinctada imbricata]|uniref:Alpha-mannosidase n=1 Tax=Pinctada imbricata TaxID=66713 RepID=A0AA89BL58_PINIB|nr:hypothetical protein FSP39_021156 [Pinctada imbricata]